MFVRYRVILNFLFGVKEIEYRNFCRMIYINYRVHRGDFDSYYDFDEEGCSPKLDRDVFDLGARGLLFVKKKEGKFYLSLKP